MACERYPAISIAKARSSRVAMSAGWRFFAVLYAAGVTDSSGASMIAPDATS